MCSYTLQDIERFWSKVDKETSTIFYNGERCWEWTAGCFSAGYGAFWIGKKLRGAHRVSHELSYGEIPDRLQVLHHCDNRPCCNPKHFFLGTYQDNVHDKVQKGRQVAGEKVGTAKLTSAQVTEIRRRYGRRGKGGESTYALAKAFGIDRTQICNIVNRKQWI